MRLKKPAGHLKEVNMKKLFRRNQIIITTLAIMIAAAGYLNYAGKKELEANAGGLYQVGALEISDEDILAENQAASYDLGGGFEEAQPQAEGNLMEAEAGGAGTAADDAAAGDAAGGTGAVQGELGAAKETGTAGTELAAAETGADGAAGTQLAEIESWDEGEETGMENPGEAVLTSGMTVSDYIANVQLNREQIRAKNKETLNSIINNTNIEESSKQDAIQYMISMTAVSEKENAAETLLQAKGFADPVVSLTDGQVDVVINAASITDQQRAQIEDIVKRKTEVGAENIVITLLNLEE